MNETNLGCLFAGRILSLTRSLFLSLSNMRTHNTLSRSVYLAAHLPQDIIIMSMSKWSPLFFSRPLFFKKNVFLLKLLFFWFVVVVGVTVALFRSHFFNTLPLECHRCICRIALHFVGCRVRY